MTRDVRYPRMLDALLAGVDEWAARQALALSIRPLRGCGPHVPAFCVEGTVALSARDAATLVRDADCSELAGDLMSWESSASGPAPTHTRRGRYVTKFPWPLSPRKFELEAWFLPPDDLPEPLRQRRAVCFVTQTPESTPERDGSGSHKHERYKPGDVLFSGYLFIPLGPSLTMLRRVISIDCALGACFPGWMQARSLRKVYCDNHEFMNSRVNKNTMAAISERQAIDPAYDAVFGQT